MRLGPRAGSFSCSVHLLSKLVLTGDGQLTHTYKCFCGLRLGWGGYARRGKYRKTQQNDILGRCFPAVQYKINIPDKKFVSIMVVFAGGVFLFVSG